jgi:hypothetical protein
MKRSVSFAVVLALMPLAGTPDWSGESSPVLGSEGRSSSPPARRVAVIREGVRTSLVDAHSAEGLHPFSLLRRLPRKQA